MKAIPKRYTNTFLSDEENEKSNLWNQELEHSNIEDDNLIICYKEDSFHVKDICVDEGIPHGERILFDENNNEMLKLELLNVSTTKDYNMESNVCSEVNGKNDHTNIERKSDVSSGTRDVVADLTVNEPMNDQDLQHSTPVSKTRWTNEEVINAFVTSELKEMSKDDISNVDGLSGSETVSKAVDHNGPDVSLQPGEKQINSSGISSLHQGRALPSLKSLFESDQQPCQSPVEKVLERPVEGESAMEENTTSNLKPHDILTVDELSKEPHDVLTVNHGGEADSSFSVAGLVSGVVTYSGHIGNISLRSDSSTTSSRSFAFPILQNEWNSSPVRMAKADRRRLQKHHGWKHGLLCCRF